MKGQPKAEATGDHQRERRLVHELNAVLKTCPVSSEPQSHLPGPPRAPRRDFLTALAAGLATAPFATSCASRPSPGGVTKPIRGSWISIWWDDRRHFYWNDICLRFTAEQWQAAVKDVADLGMEYLVLLAIAKGGKAFYDTPLLPRLETACPDPIEALLAAADRYRVKFFST